MKKILLVLALLCLAFTVASAEDIYAPAMEEIWTEATLEEFVGYWEMSVVFSDEPVDLSSYRYLDIAEDGSCTVNYGSNNDHVGFDANVSQIENGILYLADEAGENGAYYFLFDISLMGCVETLDNPGTISYLKNTAEEEDSAWYEEIAADILSYTEDAVPATDVQDLIGTWKCYAWTRENGMAVMDPDMIKMTLSFDGEQTKIVSWMLGEEDIIGAQVLVCEEGIMLLTEDDDTYYILLGEEQLMLLDDLDIPTAAMFFYTEEVWAQKEADGEFFTGVKLGAVAQLTSLEQVTGWWQATHYNLGGYMQPLYDRDMGLEILADGTAIYHEEDGEESYGWAVSIRDNYLIVTDGDESADIYFMLYENDVLVQAGDGEDFSISVYYQRSMEE